MYKWGAMATEARRKEGQIKRPPSSRSFHSEVKRNKVSPLSSVTRWRDGVMFFGLQEAASLR